MVPLLEGFEIVYPCFNLAGFIKEIIGIIHCEASEESAAAELGS
jgi:hypothetical protein